MEGKKHWMILFFLLFSLSMKASYRSEIYSAYISNRMHLWKSVIDRMDKIPDKNDELLLELINYQYGYIGYCLGIDRKQEARIYLAAAQRNLDILEMDKYNPVVINAYKSAFYGFRIGLNPMTAPLNGLKSIEYARYIVKSDPGFYLGFIQMGNIQFYMPSAFGGSKKEALSYYLKAKEILENDISELKENWNYLSLLTVIGQTYTYLKEYTSAQKIYDYILKIEPQFLYVRNELYPELLKKMKI